jgi:hypothetical protein
MNANCFVEAYVCRFLVRAALAHGYAISVFDGEAWALKRSTDEEAIKAAMFSTDNDTLTLHKEKVSSREKLRGSVLLIYGNGWDVISDYSVSLEALMIDVMKHIDSVRNLDRANVWDFLRG